MFDRSLLPAAELEFIVVTDTHYMVQPTGAVEFASRRQQTARAGVALQQIAALDVPIVIHLGDLVQEFPGTPDFDRAMHEAQQQLAHWDVQPRQAAGNHDVGDKPDATMPTRPVTPESLADYHERFGRSWYSFDEGDCHFIVLNSQIMNTGLEEEGLQRQWFVGDLSKANGKRKFVFMHLPPLLVDSSEPALGNYDNVAEPARGWLLQLLAEHEVEALFAGHVHCSFLDYLGPTRYQIANSTSFTRPGFCHMFTSSPPADQGRDDKHKLGFYLCRVLSDSTEVHFIRTAGETQLDLPDGAERIVTGTPRSLNTGSLSLTLAHPLSERVEIPLAWPSAIRQSVRNDYPLLSCLELGVNSVRVPLHDLHDPFQQQRLSVLRREGVAIVGTMLADAEDSERLLTTPVPADVVELQLPGRTRPTPKDVAKLNLVDWADLQLSTVLPGETLPGKQHPRTRHGFASDDDEITAVSQGLQGLNRPLALLCRLMPVPDITTYVDDPYWMWVLEELPHIGAIHFQLEILDEDDRQAANDVAEALFAVHTSRRKGQLFVDPLADLDRTMDVRHGLLDTLCNPRPAFHVARVLNSVLESPQLSKRMDGSRSVADHEGYREVTTAGGNVRLILPRGEFELDMAATRVWQLASGISRHGPIGRIDEPTLVLNTGAA